MSRTIQIQDKPSATLARIQEAVAFNAKQEDYFQGTNFRASKEMPPAGEIVAANASLYQQAFFNQPMTDYAVRWRDSEPIEADLAFLAPQVRGPRRFTYAEFTHIEEFFLDVADDLRPLRGDFKTVEYTSTKVEGKTDNHGLRLVIDFDEEEETSDWQEQAVDTLMRRLKRNSLVRAFNLISAAAVNTGLVFSSGADADAMVNNLRLASQTASGIGVDHLFYGDTAWAQRFQALRGNGNAAQFSSAAMTPEQLGAMLGIRKATVMKERIAASMTTLQEMVGNILLMYFAQDNPNRMDPSNIKRFVSACNSGALYATYIRQITVKLWEVVVECYENTAITSTIGITQGTTTTS